MYLEQWVSVFACLANSLRFILQHAYLSFLIYLFTLYFKLRFTYHSNKNTDRIDFLLSIYFIWEKKKGSHDVYRSRYVKLYKQIHIQIDIQISFSHKRNKKNYRNGTINKWWWNRKRKTIVQNMINSIYNIIKLSTTSKKMYKRMSFLFKYVLAYFNVVKAMITCSENKFEENKLNPRKYALKFRYPVKNCSVFKLMKKQS